MCDDVAGGLLTRCALPARRNAHKFLRLTRQKQLEEALLPGRVQAVYGKNSGEQAQFVLFVASGTIGIGGGEQRRVAIQGWNHSLVLLQL